MVYDSTVWMIWYDSWYFFDVSTAPTNPQWTEVKLEGPFHETVETLREFVAAVATGGSAKIPHPEGAAQYTHVLTILKAAEVNPMNVKRSIQAYDETSANEADNPVFGSFKAFSYGKKMVELAREFSKSRLEAFECISLFDEVKTECAAYSDQIRSNSDIDIGNMCNELLRLTKHMETATAKETVGHESWGMCLR